MARPSSAVWLFCRWRDPTTPELPARIQVTQSPIT
jgi:hypothetical protein